MKIYLLLVISLISLQIQSQTRLFDSLLQKHVSNDGVVNYKELKKDKDLLEAYINSLNNTKIEKSWSDERKKAFWINAYNAYTLFLILEKNEKKSIMNISDGTLNAWKIPFAKVAGKTYTLDYIEHQILRKELFDPRIHVGVNCASISCPKLANFAFTESNVNEKLDELMSDFINDPSRNQLTGKRVKLSEIFNWFKDDFTKKGSVIDYLNTYANTKIDKNSKIGYLPYNWNLNGN